MVYIHGSMVKQKEAEGEATDRIGMMNLNSKLNQSRLVAMCGL